MQLSEIDILNLFLYGDPKLIDSQDKVVLNATVTFIIIVISHA